MQRFVTDKDEVGASIIEGESYCASNAGSLTTFSATTRSRFMSSANCSGVLVAGTRLRAVRWRSRNSGLLTPSPMSFDTRSTTGRGVPAGAKMPYQLFDGGPL